MFVRRMGVEAITKTEEVSMHPMLIMALADKLESDRRSAGQRVRLRSLCKRSIRNAPASIASITY